MSELTVRPSYIFTEQDIVTVDKLNLIATPVVELALTDPVSDTNYFRNGNFYSSFWTTPAGMTHPPATITSNADYWSIESQGAAVITKRSTTVPDTKSLFSNEIDGANSVTTCWFGQNISGDLSATLRRNCTFSGYIYNSTGLTISPKLGVDTADAFNNFTVTTQVALVDLQTCAVGVWTYVTATIDMSTYNNITNGVIVYVFFPSGTLSAVGKNVNLSRLKFQIGEIATEFVDDVALFITTPSIDSTMLQDGCIARPSLFLPSVIPAGAYTPKSIKNGDIDDGAIDGRTMSPGIRTTLTAGFTQPAVSSSVPIQVVSTTGFVSNQSITIVGGGGYLVSSVTDATHMDVTNTGVTGNALPAATIPTGGAVTYASAIIAALGYTPINKAGDSGIGPSPLGFTNNDVVGVGSVAGAAAVISTSAGNAANDGYMPAISFSRPGTAGRSIGLDTTAKFKTVDTAGTVGYLLDSVTKVATSDYQDASVTYEKLADTLIDRMMPIGSIVAFSGPSPPGGWLICDGSAVSRAAYAVLFSRIGTYWGSGDNVSTFNIPRLVDRVPIGYGVGGNWVFGTYIGAINHAITVAEMPSHAHSITDQAHSHVMNPHTHVETNCIGALSNQPGSGAYSALGSTSVQPTTSTMNPSGTGITTTNPNGSGAPLSLMQPGAIMWYILKAL